GRPLLELIRPGEGGLVGRDRAEEDQGRHDQPVDHGIYLRSILTVWIVIGVTGLSPGFVVLVSPIFLMTSIPLTTSPNTGCFPLSQSVGASVMKNCAPPVLAAPLFAIARMPALSSLRPDPNSSGMLNPGPPVPVPSGSPPWIMKFGITRWNVNPL